MTRDPRPGHDIRLGALRVHWWRPRYPTKIGTHAVDGMRTVSLRYLMLRYWMVVEPRNKASR